MLKKIISAAAAAALLFTSQLTVFAGEAEKAESAGIAIIHTNDIHCSYAANDNTFGYAELAAYKAKLQEEGYDVILVDAGDYAQGGVLGTLSDGEYPIEIMNALGYSYAAVGNHEFDFGFKRLLELRGKAKFEMLSCNIKDKKTGANIFTSAALDVKTKVGFVGATVTGTPLKSNPANFRDKNGKLLYDFCEGNDGKDLYDCIQASVDSLRDAGMEYVVLLSHLGVEEKDSPCRSRDVIANTNGIDAVIDAHSHLLLNETVKNKDGKEVLLTSVGTQLIDIGTVYITSDGIYEKSVAKGEYEVPDDKESAEYKAYAKAEKKIGSIEEKFNELVNTVVAKSDVDLYSLDPENHYDWAVRVSETNMGDLAADAYRATTGADIGFINGGGVRADIPAGDITYGQIIAAQPFGNSLCVVEATGQEILDALEMGARAYPEPIGGFLQVSGVTFEIHSYIESSVLTDDGKFVGVNGEYRVKNVKVNGEPLDLDKTYTIASHTYMIKNGGDSMSMFMDNRLIADEIELDNQALIDYITKDLGGVIGKEYENIYGSGRITVITEAPAAGVQTEVPHTGNTGADVTVTIMITAAGAAALCRKKKQ